MKSYSIRVLHIRESILQVVELDARGRQLVGHAHVEFIDFELLLVVLLLLFNEGGDLGLLLVDVVLQGPGFVFGPHNDILEAGGVIIHGEIVLGGGKGNDGLDAHEVGEDLLPGPVNEGRGLVLADMDLVFEFFGVGQQGLDELQEMRVKLEDGGPDLLDRPFGGLLQFGLGCLVGEVVIGLGHNIGKRLANAVNVCSLGGVKEPVDIFLEHHIELVQLLPLLRGQVFQGVLEVRGQDVFQFKVLEDLEGLLDVLACGELGVFVKVGIQRLVVIGRRPGRGHVHGLGLGAGCQVHDGGVGDHEAVHILGATWIGGKRRKLSLGGGL